MPRPTRANYSVLCSVMLGLGPQTTFLLVPCQELPKVRGTLEKNVKSGEREDACSLLFAPHTLPVYLLFRDQGSSRFPLPPPLNRLSLPLGVIGCTLQLFQYSEKQLLQGPSNTPAPAGQPLPRTFLSSANPLGNV